MRNKYKGYCLVCGKEILPKQGFFQRMYGRWVVRCENCVGKGNLKENNNNN